MCRTVRWCLVFALCWSVCVRPALADDRQTAPSTDSRTSQEESLSPAEQREALSYLAELEAIRQEVQALRAVVQKDAETLAALRLQVTALEKVVEVQGHMLAQAERLFALQERVIKTYEAMVAKAEERARHAEARADRAGVLAWLTPITALLGIIAGAFAAGI